MRITCPSCEAAYEVPDAVLTGARRKMRCARCANQWTPQETAGPAPVARPAPATATPPALAPVSAPALPDLVGRSALTVPVAADVAPRPERFPPPPESRLTISRPLVDAMPPEPPRPRGRGAAVAGWLLTVAVLAALGYGAVTKRQDIQAVWPPSQRLYAALGLR